MSIKNKFATAVATASLLAGLFGSAFVPSAMGAIVGGTSAVAPKYTTIAAKGDGLARVGSTTVFGFQSADYVDTDLTSATDANGSAAGDNWVSFGLYSAKDTLLDLDASGNTDLILKASSSNSNVNVGWALNDAGAAAVCNKGDGAGATVDEDVTYGTTSQFTSPAGNGTYQLCLAAEKDTTAATSTITISVDGVVAKTITVTAVGPIASLTAALAKNGFKYVAEDNDFVNNFFTIIAKDANGTQINGKSSSISSEDLTIYDWEGNPENAQGDILAPFNGSDSGSDSKYAADNADIYYDLDDDTCLAPSGPLEEDGDAGASYTVKFADAAEDADVVSNGITITCTLNSDGARVTAVTPEATSGARTYNEPSNGDTYRESDDLLGLFATVVDADGKPLGAGADYVDFGWELTSGSELLDYTTGFADMEGDEYYGSRLVREGKFMLGTLSPVVTRDGQFTYVITANDSDFAVTAAGDDAVVKSFTLKYTVGQSDDYVLSRVRNAAKTVATFTADMGEDAAYDTITFWVEYPNGRTVGYDRLSNGAGVAKLVLAKRNMKVTVYAQFLGFSNTVAARFR